MRVVMLLILGALVAVMCGCGAVEANEAMEDLQARLDQIEQDNEARMEAMARLVAAHDYQIECFSKSMQAWMRYVSKKEAEDEDSTQ